LRSAHTSAGGGTGGDPGRIGGGKVKRYNTFKNKNSKFMIEKRYSGLKNVKMLVKNFFCKSPNVSAKTSAFIRGK